MRWRRKVVIELVFTGPCADDGVDCIDNLLDLGVIQDAVIDYATDTGRDLGISSALVREVG